MDPKPTESPDQKAQVVPDLPLTEDQASDIKGGKLLDGKSPNIYDKTCTGKHLPEVVTEV